jgi:hypothetical protein
MSRSSVSGKPAERNGEQRRAGFKAAIALARTTVEQWCADNGVTTGHLYQVLRGVRESPPLLEKVDAFINEHLSAHAA